MTNNHGQPGRSVGQENPGGCKRQEMADKPLREEDVNGASSMLEQFEEMCEAVFRPELRENKEIEHFRNSKD
jgi:hypothetical protein